MKFMKTILVGALTCGLSMAAVGFADYRTSVEKKLTDWDKQIETLRSKIHKTPEENKDALRSIVTELQSHRDDVDGELKRLPSDEVDSQDLARKRIEQHFTAMNKLVKKTQSAE